MYKNSSFTVKITGHFTKPSKIERGLLLRARGVIQRATISSLLYNQAPVEIFKKLQWDTYYLRYEDDIKLITDKT